ncbi:molybdopterin guanine dinucleotide-containing S/N-oxide reductase [Antarcticimicrobium sediminis]|uniref:Asp-tRNA(Asn)/Glu-tRNA(Gln) amidotransferase GatCAB subunit C n=1 Tax=Antarcticimicrobium sediminis TaxID=2546227 RepID=A0A4R5EJV9_9RHOB|nr:molybdopterin guanine dinucleotide-containing S/N-oxide reductase [Antarcticimicrobium sediminis]TDE34915.1 Asp-tRNA(Asn)/Glu-tRNA(Gln) amidotransferase GatCAB subunit C [Antarcticimicrobium sediminis]
MTQNSFKEATIASTNRDLLTSAHWGTYWVDVSDGRVTNLRTFEHDPDPSPIGHGIVNVMDGPLRITSPAVRKSWLEHGPGTRGDLRGQEDFVSVSWDEAERLVATELDRVRTQHGNDAIYAGSYGWASAGRFHHAQSQLKRFLNCIGGFTSSVNTYSYAAAEVIMPHVLGDFSSHLERLTCWEVLTESCELFVAFGGLPVSNGQIGQGGVGAHVQRAGMLSAHANGTRFVNVSPMRSDALDQLGADWLPLRPSSDTAMMLGLAQTLIEDDLHDSTFLDRYTVGFERFAAYLRGDTDGIAKNAEWAAALCDIPAARLRTLAHDMAAHRTMISTSYSLTRQEHGEQPIWAAIALAAMLGQIGLPGGGFGFGYSAMNNNGLNRRYVPYAALPQGKNPVKSYIPVARVSDMLSNPGGTVNYNGRTLTFPNIRLVWWAGGNPFHHHQDLNRLRAAWARPDTVIANEWCWNSLARHADIVLPCTTPLERRDIAMTSKDPFITAMDPAVPPVGEARDDHVILRGIAARMGVEDAFTEGRSPDDWLHWIYETSRESAARGGITLPDFDTFQQQGWVRVPLPEKRVILMEQFRTDPETYPLKTPSGKIEIFSETVAGFDYEDCPGHPAWLEPLEWLGRATLEAPLHMISPQPKTKLHSQLDHGIVSRSDRINGRAPVLMHPKDAAERGLAEGQTVRIFNQRGACMAGLKIDESIRPGVVQIATGAWYDPDGPTCLHGNPNTLTQDRGTSQLAQGPIAHSCLVQIEAAKCETKPKIDNPPIRSKLRSAKLACG